jgi:bacillolysin
MLAESLLLKKSSILKTYLVLLTLISMTLFGCTDVALSSNTDSETPAPDSLSNGQLVEISLQHIKIKKDKYQISNPDERLLLRNVNRDQYNTQHLEFTQQYNEIPIWGDEILVHIRDKEVYLINGNIFPDGFLLSSPTVPKLTSSDAEEIAMQEISISHSGANSKSQLVILPDSIYSGRLCYFVEVTFGLNRHLLFVDALNGTILKKLEGMPG